MKMAQYEEIKILPMIFDDIFKMYFSNQNNELELKFFLETFLDFHGDDLAQIVQINNELPKQKEDDKKSTVDLILKTEGGNIIHVEMQKKKHDNMSERFQIYNARILGSNIKIGEQYHEVKRSVSIIVVNEAYFKDGEYHERIKMRRKNGKDFTNLQEINIIDLTRLNEIAEVDKAKHAWGRLFLATTMEELKMLSEEAKEMAGAVGKLVDISGDPIAILAAEQAWRNAVKEDLIEAGRLKREKEEQMRLEKIEVLGKRVEEEQRKVEEGQKRLEEEQRRVEEEQRRVEEEQRRVEEEQRRVEEEQRRVEEEQKRLGEEQKRLKENQKSLEEERKKFSEVQNKIEQAQGQLEQEVQQKTIDFAKRLLKRGLDIQDIVEDTQLPFETIQQLRNSLL